LEDIKRLTERHWRRLELNEWLKSNSKTTEMIKSEDVNWIVSAKLLSNKHIPCHIRDFTMSLWYHSLALNANMHKYYGKTSAELEGLEEELTDLRIKRRDLAAEAKSLPEADATKIIKLIKSIRRANKYSSDICTRCDLNKAESLEHFLIECSAAATTDPQTFQMVLNELSENHALMGHPTQWFGPMPPDCPEDPSRHLRCLNSMGIVTKPIFNMLTILCRNGRRASAACQTIILTALYNRWIKK
jgi:hypothetical protein